MGFIKLTKTDNRPMGSILSTKREKGGVIIEAFLNSEEILQLKGHMDEIHILSEKVAEFKTNIACRGKNDSTKYFLIPQHLRKDINITEPVGCQRIDTSDKAIFIYVTNKNNFCGVKKTSSHIRYTREMTPIQRVDIGEEAWN